MIPARRILQSMTVAAAAGLAALVIVHGPSSAEEAAGRKLEPAAPADALVNAIRQLVDKAGTDFKDEEFDDAVGGLAVAAELANLLTLQDNAGLKAWAAKTVEALTPAVKGKADKKAVEDMLKAAAAQLAEADKHAAAWSASKPVPGAYLPINRKLTQLMSFVGSRHNRAKRALGGVPTQAEADKIVAALWAVSEIGSIAGLYRTPKPADQKDWDDLAAAQRKWAAKAAKALAIGDLKSARGLHEKLQENCKACHEKFQPNGPGPLPALPGN